MIDLSLTILDNAGANPDYTDDGRKTNLHQHGEKNLECYRTLRIHDEHDDKSHSHSYSVWCTDEREHYDLEKDPKQINNLLSPLNELGAFSPFNSTILNGEPALSHHLQNLFNRLEALLLVLKRCTIGEACHNPYRELAPSSQATGGEIFKFSQILESRFDAFLRTCPRFSLISVLWVSKKNWRNLIGRMSGSMVRMRVMRLGEGIVFQGF
ncbi:hypothetical protein CNBC6400 [Cryptococcus deneoformans B-3501A]|uniref:hypothetical protein n=1 Tax=Cryptococcus deneoformans (strain B-3501A) TaxID=283643 RepID=UPI000042C109|nr:hypothetical protein CNBC6400 [Cryptococcus neoformans var. neoformans B-3501A]EAL21603.1 hypothetical protein CNBC6400 [Cryptococcus neoformans var. neoformans B-3501A]